MKCPKCGEKERLTEYHEYEGSRELSFQIDLILAQFGLIRIRYLIETWRCGACGERFRYYTPLWWGLCSTLVIGITVILCMALWVTLDGVVAGMAPR